MTIENTKTILNGSKPTDGAEGVIGRFASRAADLVFPTRCSLCSQPRELQSPCQFLCAKCSTIVENERSRAACPMCAVSVAPFEVTSGRCRQCRPRRPRVGGTVRVGEYCGSLGQLVRLCKYSGHERLGPLLGAWLAEAIGHASWLERVELIVSVPTHWRRRLKRPLHVAEVLANVVERQTGLPHLSVLRRVRSGPHQIGLDPLERARNVRGAFAIRRGVRLEGTRVLLVDDVKTTGATINECAKILRGGGAAEVYAAVVATVLWAPGADKVLSLI